MGLGEADPLRGAKRCVAVREAVREAARYARGLVSVECADDEGRWC